jgi:hypothetical protein
MTERGTVFNPPPGWPKPPAGWIPPTGWSPDPTWPEPPAGWQLWLSDNLVEQAPTAPAVHPPDKAEAAPARTRAEARASAPRSTPNGSSLPAAPLVTEASRIAYLEAENASLRAQINASTPDEYVELDDARVLQDVGIYRYHHPLESAAAYQDKLRDLERAVAEVISSGRAIVRSELFTLNNSLSQGRRMTDDLAKLMLRAYNAEADNAIRTLRAGNVVTAKKRLDASKKAIAKLGSLMEMHISDEFHELRVREIELTADWLIKKQQEREAEREERARLREEKRVERELAEERARLDKERLHLVNTLAALQQTGDVDEALVERLAAIDEAIVQNDFRAANIRAGYVYVISNQGAFGKNVVKIGLTRRLEPRERIFELGGASVPFRFDTHALFFSEDAVTLEADLHRYFADRAVNRANARKEFFFATPSEVRDVLISKVGNILEFTDEVEATEYRQSVSLWPVQ